MKTVVFIGLSKYRHENPGGAQELKKVKIVMKTMIFKVVPRGPTGAIQKFQPLTDRSGLSHHSL